MNTPARFAVLCMAGALPFVAACTSVEQASFNSWLNSPTTQSEIGVMQNFAFGILMAYLDSHVGATQRGTPDFSAIEPKAIAAVEKKYGLNAIQAAYVVKQAEAQITSAP